MNYGQSLYGTSLYADSPDNLSEDKSVDLMNYLPDFYREILEFRELIGTEGREIGQLRYESDSVLNQLFVSTATWGLALWEAELGMASEPSKPAAQRREQINAKLRGSGTTTRQMIVETAASFSGGEVDVIEYPVESRFVVKFIGVLGIPPNMPGFIRMLEQVKPAHLAYSLEYTFTTWSMLGDLTWSEAAANTWDGLKTYGGV